MLGHITQLRQECFRKVEVEKDSQARVAADSKKKGVAACESPCPVDLPVEDCAQAMLKASYPTPSALLPVPFGRNGPWSSPVQ